MEIVFVTSLLSTEITWNVRIRTTCFFVVGKVEVVITLFARGLAVGAYFAQGFTVADWLAFHFFREIVVVTSLLSMEITWDVRIRTTCFFIS